MSVAEKTLDRIRAQLRAAKEIGGNVPQDLYSHLTEVFNRILMHHSEDAYDKFEEISALVKQTDLKFKDPAYDYEVNMVYGKQDVTERQKWVEKSKNLLNEVNDLVAASDKSLITKNKNFVIPNFAEEAEMLEWAGVSFGEENTIRLGKSIKRLALMSGADSLRFVGKIFGTQKDYWLVAGRLSTAEEAPMDNLCEPRGVGVNSLVYWVTDNLLNDWIQLPDCHPQWIC
jgi:radial spoke head protein 4/6